jgi:hypothetical protein
MMERMKLLSALFLACSMSSFGLFSYTPPGTEKISVNGETLFVDRTEILNLHWAEYLHNIQKEHGKESQAYQRALPNGSIWCSAYGDSLQEITDISGEHARHPVVGIDRERAEAFCKWRSERVNEKYEDQRTRYRLLTPQEYEGIREVGGECEEKNAPYPYPRKSEVQRALSKKRVQGIRGNVRELTSDPDSIWSSEGVLDKDTLQQEEEAPTLLGFRCAAEVKKR